MKLFLSKVDLHEMPNKREKLIFTITLLGFLLVFVKSCWYPSRKAIDDVRGEMTVIEEEYQGIEKKTANGLVGRKNIQNQWKGSEESLAKYRLFASKVADDTDAYLMREFSNQTLLRDLKMVGINFIDSKEAGSKDVIKQGFEMSLKGSFFSTGEYLRNLENLPILLILNSVEVTTIGDSFGQVNTSISGVAYGWK